MGQLCVNGKWDGQLVWTRVGLEGGNAEADRLLDLYEKGNAKAQAGDLPGALALFQQGLSGFAAIETPDPHHRIAEAALLWGLGTALDRTRKGEEGWQTLLRIIGPGSQREMLPVGLAINWSHTATLAGFRHGKYLEVCAVLDALQRLGWSEQLQGADDAAQAVRDRFTMLSDFKVRCFEALMKEKRFEDAERIAADCLSAQRQCEPEDGDALEFWTELERAASKRDQSFRLPEAGADAPPALRVLWDGESDDLGWKMEEPPEDPHLSSLAHLYAEAAQAADRGDHARSLKLYDEGLAKWEAMATPRSADSVVRAMMLWGKAAVQDQLQEEGSPEAWQTLMQMAKPDKGVALPIPLLLRWVGSSVIVGTHLGRWPQVRTLLVMLMKMALHPQLGQVDRELHGELVHRFLTLLEGAYGGLEADPQLAADWVRSLQGQVEPSGLILLPLRDLLFHALSAASRHAEAEAVAVEVAAWGRQEGDRQTVREWEARAAAAKSAGA